MSGTANVVNLLRAFFTAPNAHSAAHTLSLLRLSVRMPLAGEPFHCFPYLLLLRQTYFEGQLWQPQNLNKLETTSYRTLGLSTTSSAACQHHLLFAHLLADART